MRCIANSTILSRWSYALLLTVGVFAACGDTTDSDVAADTSPDTVDVSPDTTPDVTPDSVEPDVTPDSVIPDVTPDTTPDTTDVTPDTTPSGPPDAIVALESALTAAAPADRPAVLTTWLAALPSAPITDDTTAVFLFNGAATEVRMVGDATGWNAQVSPKLTRLDFQEVDLWWLAQTYERNARLDYKLVVNGSDWRLDALNPRTMAGGFGPNSELTMPDYVTPAEAANLTTAQAGTMTSHVIESEALQQSRTIYVYVAPGAVRDNEVPRPLAIFHDGNDYRSLIRTPLILDRVVDTGDVGPLVAVFAQPTERTVEYNRNDNYVRHLAEEVVPFMRTTYNAGLTPAVTGTIGPSFGGLIACYAAITRPEVFGLAGCQSGAHSYDDDAMIELVKSTPKVDVKLHLIVGTYELAVSGSTDEGNLLEAQRRMVAALTAKTYTFASEEHPQGHSWGLWRDRLPTALRYLYGD